MAVMNGSAVDSAAFVGASRPHMRGQAALATAAKVPALRKSNMSDIAGHEGNCDGVGRGGGPHFGR
jgi:hypothetical protein